MTSPKQNIQAQAVLELEPEEPKEDKQDAHLDTRDHE